MHTFDFGADFNLFNLNFEQFASRWEREQEDPARARRLVEGLEEVPVGLVRRLERVGLGGGVSGGAGGSPSAGTGAHEEGANANAKVDAKEQEEEEDPKKMGIGADGGDSGCAICWDHLLLDPEEEEQVEQREPDAFVQPETTLVLPSESSLSSSSPVPNSKPQQEHSNPGPTSRKVHPKIVALPCAHVFHAACLVPWFTRPNQTTCPTCRFNVDPEGKTASARGPFGGLGGFNTFGGFMGVPMPVPVHVPAGGRMGGNGNGSGNSNGNRGARRGGVSVIPIPLGMMGLGMAAGNANGNANANANIGAGAQPLSPPQQEQQQQHQWRPRQHGMNGGLIFGPIPLPFPVPVPVEEMIRGAAGQQGQQQQQQRQRQQQQRQPGGSMMPGDAQQTGPGRASSNRRPDAGGAWTVIPMAYAGGSPGEAPAGELSLSSFFHFLFFPPRLMFSRRCTFLFHEIFI